MFVLKVKITAAKIEIQLLRYSSRSRSTLLNQNLFMLKRYLGARSEPLAYNRIQLLLNNFKTLLHFDALLVMWDYYINIQPGITSLVSGIFKTNKNNYLCLYNCDLYYEWLQKYLQYGSYVWCKMLGCWQPGCFVALWRFLWMFWNSVFYLRF